jgi:hypothetical protein
MRGTEPKDTSSNVELRWHIGKESEPFDRPPYRAYFYWIENYRLVGSVDYDAEELAAEIERRGKLGKDTEPFRAAQKRLANLNG